MKNTDVPMVNSRMPQNMTEAEEARWWFDHREELATDFIQALVDGRVTRGTLAKRVGLAGE